MFTLGNFKIKNLVTGECVSFTNFEWIPRKGCPAIDGYTLEFTTKELEIVDRWLRGGNQGFDGELIQVFKAGAEETALQLKGVFVSSYGEDGRVSIFCQWIIFIETSETGGIMRKTYEKVVRESLKNFNEQLGINVFPNPDLVL